MCRGCTPHYLTERDGASSDQGIIDLDERWIIILRRDTLVAIAGYS
jgi:hypothetical protein